MISAVLYIAIASASAKSVGVNSEVLDRISSPAPILNALIAPDGLVYVLDNARHLTVYDSSTMRIAAGPIDWPRTTFNFFPTKVRGTLATLDVSGGTPHIVLRRVLKDAPDNSVRVDLPGRVAGFANPLGGELTVLTQSDDGSWSANTVDAVSGDVVSSQLPKYAQDFVFAPGNRPIAALLPEQQGASWKPLTCSTENCPSRSFSSEAAFEGVIGGMADGTGANVWWRLNDLRVPALWQWGELQPHEIGRIANADVSDVLVDSNSGKVQAVAGGVFNRKWFVIDPKIRVPIERLQHESYGFPQILDRTPDGTKWIVADVTDQAPTVVSVFTTKTGHLEALPGQPDVGTIPKARGVWVTARDGLRIPVYLSAPTKEGCDFQRKRCGLVVLIHGGPQHRDERVYSPDAALLQRMGLWVLRVNFRGSSGFGSKFVSRGNGEWGRKISFDIIDALTWAAKQPGVNSRRMCTAGESFGGFTAINVASLRPDLVACAASLNGGGDLELFATEVVSHHPELAPGLSRQLADPKTPTGLNIIRSQSPMSRLSALRMPLLLAYGENDDTTPPGQTTSLSAALEHQTGSHAVTLAFPGEGHVLSAPAQRDYRAALSNFLAHSIDANARVVENNDDTQPRVTGEVNLVSGTNNTDDRP